MGGYGYRSAANAEFMAKNGFVSHVHRKKPKGRVMPKAVRRGEQRQIENPPAHRACLRRAMDLFLRTIGTARATTKIGLANLVYNIKRLLFLRRIAAA